MAITPLTAEAKDSLQRATTQYMHQLLEDDEGLEYLEVERGLDRATIFNFRLGVVRQPVDDSHRRFTGMICIPNLGGAADAHPVGLKFRSLDPNSKHKYDQPDGQVARLFNLRALHDPGDTLWVTEGEFDAICLAEVGLPAIAVPGANHWGKSHIYRNRLVEGRQVVLCRDSDDAALALVKAMQTLDDLVVRGFAPHKDVNDYYKAEGPQALYEKATGAR